MRIRATRAQSVRARAEGGAPKPPPRRPRMRILPAEERQKRRREREALEKEGGRILSESSPSEPLQVVKVEDEGVEVEGIARVDRGETVIESEFKTVGSTAALIAGDAAVLVAFAAIGRLSHGESLDAGALALTALPFLVGWFSAGYFVSGFGNSAWGKNGVNQAIEPALKTWALGVPTGILLRTLGRGYLPPKAFVIVTLVLTLVLMVGWRYGYATLVEPKEFKRTPAQRGNTKGNPLEFLDMIFGLIKRW